MPPITTQINGGKALWGGLNNLYVPYVPGAGGSVPDNYIMSLSYPARTYEFTQDFSFVSNGVTYDSLHYVCTMTVANNKLYYVTNSVETLVWQNNNWTDEKYRIFEFPTQTVREGIYGLVSGNSQFLTDRTSPTGNSCSDFGYMLDLQGNYIFSGSFDNKFSMEFPFVSKGSNFINMYYNIDSKELTYTSIDYVNYVYVQTRVYNNGRWIDDNYKKIYISETTYGDYSYKESLLEYYTKISSQKIDVSTLSGWEDLASGEHSITIKTKANGYVDSENSNAVSVSKPVSGETWLLNETIEGVFSAVDINFVSNAANYTKISIDAVGAPIERHQLYYNGNNVYYTPTGWSDEAYRTITFETAPSGGLLKWLQANGVKQ